MCSQAFFAVSYQLEGWSSAGPALGTSVLSRLLSACTQQQRRQERVFCYI